VVSEKPADNGGVRVRDRDLKASLVQAAGHRSAHLADADETQAAKRAHSLASASV
jgi:hypothetical protein